MKEPEKAKKKKAAGKPKTAKTRSLLHVGCGPKTIANLPAWFAKGWKETRLDIDPRAKPDIEASLTDMSAVKTASHDALWASHVVEHIYPHEAFIACREMRRVLKKDGFAIINCPDVRSIAAVIAERGLDAELYVSKAGPVTARDALYGWGPALKGGNTEMAHRNGFDLASMRDLFSRCGFAHSFGRRVRFDLWFIASAGPRATVEADALLAEIINRQPTIQAETASS